MFSKLKDKRIALISCIAMWLCTIRAYTSYYSSVGYCIVYFSLGLSTTFIVID